MWRIFRGRFAVVFQPHFHHNSTTFTSQFTTFLHTKNGKTPAKTPLHHVEKITKCTAKVLILDDRGDLLPYILGIDTITFSVPVAVCRSITGSGGEGTCGPDVSGAETCTSPTTPSSVIQPADS